MTQTYHKVGNLYHFLFEHILKRGWFKRLVPKTIRNKLIRTYYYLYAMKQAWKDIHVDASAFSNGKVKIAVVKRFQIYRNEYWDKTFTAKKDGSIKNEFVKENKSSHIGEMNAILHGCRMADRNQKILSDCEGALWAINSYKPIERYANKFYYKQLVEIRHLKNKKNLKIESIPRELNVAGLLLENDIILNRINGDRNA